MHASLVGLNVFNMNSSSTLVVIAGSAPDDQGFGASVLLATVTRRFTLDLLPGLVGPLFQGYGSLEYEKLCIPYSTDVLLLHKR